VVFHHAGLSGHRFERDQRIIDRVIADALDGDGAVAAFPHRVLHRLLSDLAGLAAVDVGDAADEGALQIAEGVAAHPLDAELELDLLAQQVGERAGAGKLHVAVRVLLQFARETGDDGRAMLVVDALRHRDDAAAVFVVGRLHVG